MAGPQHHRLTPGLPLSLPLSLPLPLSLSPLPLSLSPLPLSPRRVHIYAPTHPRQSCAHATTIALLRAHHSFTCSWLMLCSLFCMLSFVVVCIFTCSLYVVFSCGCCCRCAVVFLKTIVSFTISCSCFFVVLFLHAHLSGDIADYVRREAAARGHEI